MPDLQLWGAMVGIGIAWRNLCLGPAAEIVMLIQECNSSSAPGFVPAK